MKFSYFFLDRNNSIETISGMFYKNVYGNMNHNSINSIHNLEGEQLGNDTKYREFISNRKKLIMSIFLNDVTFF